MDGVIKKLKDASVGEYYFPVTVGDAVFLPEGKSLAVKFDELKQQTGGAYTSYVVVLSRWQIAINHPNNTDKQISKETSHRLTALSNGRLITVIPKSFYREGNISLTRRYPWFHKII